MARCRAAGRPDWGRAWLNCVDRLNSWLCLSYHRLHYDPIPLPATGPAIVVANHLSGLDPEIMIAASARPLRFIIAREQYESYGLTWLFRAIGCIPVERERRPQAALLNALRALQAGEVVALFPEGGFRLPGTPPRRLKGGAVWLAKEVGCPIFPVYVSGIRAAGKTLPAVFIPSRARLMSFPAITCSNRPDKDCLDELARLLSGELEFPEKNPI